MVQKLDAVGALTLFGLSKETEKLLHQSDDRVEDADDSDYDDDDDVNNNNNDDILDEYFLSSNDFRTYGDHRSDYF